MSDYGRVQASQDLGPLFAPLRAGSEASGRRPSPEAAKREGMDRAEAGNPCLARELRQIAEQIATSTGRWITIDDVRDEADRRHLVVPSPAMWGTVFRGPGWECVGFELSRRPGKNAHRQPRWRWKGQA